MAQRFQNTNQLFSIQRTTLQRQLYKFKAQPSTFQVEGNKYNYMGNGIYICKDMPMVVKKQDVSLLQLKKIEFTLIGMEFTSCLFTEHLEVSDVEEYHSIPK